MKQINKNIADFLIKQKKVTIGFSTGKDSVCCAAILRNLGVEYIPFYHYVCPDLEFVQKNIEMYERVLKIKIVQLPHPMLYDFLRHQDFQPPKMINFLSQIELPKFTFSDLVNCYLDYINDPNSYYDVAGVRAAESFNRRMVFKNSNGIEEKDKKIYPIFNWKKADVLEYLSDNKIPLIDDYKYWNRSYDGMKYQFLFGVKKNYPKDWQTLLEFFPLLEAELFRYEQNQKYF